MKNTALQISTCVHFKVRFVVVTYSEALSRLNCTYPLSVRYLFVALFGDPVTHRRIGPPYKERIIF